MRCSRENEGRKLNLKIIPFTSPSYEAEYLGLVWSTFRFENPHFREPAPSLGTPTPSTTASQENRVQVA